LSYQTSETFKIPEVYVSVMAQPTDPNPYVLKKIFFWVTRYIHSQPIKPGSH